MKELIVDSVINHNISDPPDEPVNEYFVGNVKWFNKVRPLYSIPQTLIRSSMCSSKEQRAQRCR